MMTSAQGLLQVFTLASLQGNPQDRFLSTAADVIGLTSEDREAEALLMIARSIRQVKSDIDGLNFDEAQIKLLHEKVSVFNPLLTFEHAHLNNAQVRDHCLKSANLVGLSFVHMTLAGFKRMPELDREAQGLADEFRTIREDIAKSNLPDDLKQAIILRLNQIAAALDHFAFFGAQRIEQEFAALVGELVVRKASFSQESDGLFKRIANALTKAVGAVKGANDAMIQGQVAVENVNEIYLGISEIFK